MELKKSILKTIAFFDIFDFPLTAEEIKEYLYKYDRPLHIKEVKGTLEEMDEVEKIHDYYVLKNRTKLAGLRKNRKLIAEDFWNKVRQYCMYVSEIPFVRMIAVCNNLAYNNPTELSDIDLFIVIEKGRMWTARLWITLLLQFFGVRRHGSKIPGRFCLSFFVTNEKLDMEPLSLKEDPYLAYWTKLMRPVYGKKTYKEFISANEKWLSDKYKMGFKDIKDQKFSFKESTPFKRLFEKLLKDKFGNTVENTIKKIFKKRTLQKAKKLGPKSGNIVTDDMLKFHDDDRREEYLNKWKNII